MQAGEKVSQKATYRVCIRVFYCRARVPLCRSRHLYFDKRKEKAYFIPLTDNNQYNSQLYIKLYPDRSCIEIKAPIYVMVNRYKDYLNQIGISFGMNTMLTTDKGNSYGEALGRYQRNMQIGCEGRQEVIIGIERIIPVARNTKRKNIDLRSSFTVILTMS